MDDKLIFKTAHFSVSQAAYRVPGYLIVESLNYREQVHQFDQQEQLDLIGCISRSEALVQHVIRPERIYVMKFAEQNPRLHFHIFPRCNRVGRAYEAAEDDSKPYNGARLVDWVWQNHHALGFSDAEIQQFARDAKIWLARHE